MNGSAGRAIAGYRDTTIRVPSDLLSSSLLTNAGFPHAFTTRGSGDFATLRDPERLREYQERLAAGVGFDRSRLYQTKQVHGRNVVACGGDPAELLRVEADGLVAEPGTGHAAAVRVADCVPVLLASRDTGRVSAVHAGWRGVEARILEVALAKLGAPGSVVAAIGPCIGPCCFEVGADVAARLGHVVRREGDKAHVDLRAAVRAQLVLAGVSDASVEDVPGCTKHEAERFHSYRRDGDASGRLIAVVVAR